MRGRGSISGVPPETKRSGLIIETTKMGPSLKVTAVDEASGIEVSFVAPVNASRAATNRLAQAKLAYVLKKKNDGH